MRTTSKLTSKHQVTLPDYVVETLEVKPADFVTFIIKDKDIVIKKIPNLLDIGGSVKTKKKHDDQKADKAVGEGIAKEYNKKWNQR